jgi:single-strand DNA-binding protein
MTRKEATMPRKWRTEMADLNIIALSGNLVSTPEVRHTNQGNAVCNLRIANNGYSQEEGALFIDLVVWGKDAEYAARTCKKGTFVEVNGRLTQRSYTDREGNDRKVYEVKVRDFHAKARTLQNESTGGGYTSPGGSDNTAPDSIPF